MTTQQERVQQIVEDVKREWAKPKRQRTIWKTDLGTRKIGKPNLIPKRILDLLTIEKKETIAYIRNKYKECQVCQWKANLTIDHIIPVSYLKNMGFYSIETMTRRHRKNLELLCPQCNNKKGDKINLTDKRTRKLLVWYLKNYEKLKWTGLE